MLSISVDHCNNGIESGGEHFSDEDRVKDGLDSLVLEEDMGLDGGLPHRHIIKLCVFHVLHYDRGLPAGSCLLSLLVLYEGLDEVVPVENVQGIGCICWHVPYGMLSLLIFCHIKFPEVRIAEAFWRFLGWFNLFSLDCPWVLRVLFHCHFIGLFDLL